MEGLSSARNIQGSPADVLVAVLNSRSISPVLKWLDDFVLFRTPSSSYIDVDGIPNYTYSHDLSTVMDVTTPLGIPWHPVETKGQDFDSKVSYIGFIWDLKHHSVSLAPKKHLKYLAKVRSFLHAGSSKIC